VQDVSCKFSKAESIYCQLHGSKLSVHSLEKGEAESTRLNQQKKDE